MVLLLMSTETSMGRYKISATDNQYISALGCKVMKNQIQFRDLLSNTRLVNTFG